MMRKGWSYGGKRDKKIKIKNHERRKLLFPDGTSIDANLSPRPLTTSLIHRYARSLQEGRRKSGMDNEGLRSGFRRLFSPEAGLLVHRRDVRRLWEDC